MAEAVDELTINGHEHDRGDLGCCGGFIHEDCGGIVHGQYVDEGRDYVTYEYRCDRCYEEVRYP
jgi:hypothetical protein